MKGVRLLSIWEASQSQSSKDHSVGKLQFRHAIVLLAYLIVLIKDFEQEELIIVNLRPFPDLPPRKLDFQDFSRPGKGAFEISDILRLFNTPREH